MRDSELIDALYERLQSGAIRIELEGHGEGYAALSVCAGCYGFGAMAYPRPLRQGDV